MDPRPLHPNLARLDADYDEIVARFARREITADEAHAQVRDLRARDDEGVIWSKDPSDGGWLRQTRTGAWEKTDTPPVYGVATPTPHDLSGGSSPTNPDNRIDFVPVDERAVWGENSLRASTRTSPARSVGRSRRQLVTYFIVAVIIGMLIALVVWLPKHTTSTPKPSTTTTQPAPNAVTPKTAAP